METVARDAFRMFLGVSAQLEGWNAEATACTLRCVVVALRRASGKGVSTSQIFPVMHSTAQLRFLLPCACCSPCRLTDNPLADFVELPPAYGELRYSNILCGALRGALEMVSVRADVR